MVESNRDELQFEHLNIFNFDYVIYYQTKMEECDDEMNVLFLQEDRHLIKEEIKLDQNANQ
jgi:hypothetical protein